MGFIVVGLLLVILGIVLTFTSLLGFIPGVPIFGIGLAFVAIGAVFWLLALPFRFARWIRDRARSG